MGMLLAASNCPLLAIFQPMVRFHLPFARRDETVYRVLSMYALAQYVHNQQGEDVDVDLEALADMYREIQVVNRSLASRLRTAATTDAPTNAIAILDTFAQIIPCVIEDSLTDLEELFEPYLRKCTRHVRTLHVQIPRGCWRQFLQGGFFRLFPGRVLRSMKFRASKRPVGRSVIHLPSRLRGRLPVGIPRRCRVVST